MKRSSSATLERRHGWRKPNSQLRFRWCIPYRLDRITRRPLIANEDIYAAGLAVWELFVEEIPFADIDSDDDEADLEGKIQIRVDC